jgi:hypothetical protein
VIVAGPRRDGGKTLLRQLFSAAACIRDCRIALDKLTQICAGVELRTLQRLKDSWLRWWPGSDAHNRSYQADAKFIGRRGSSPRWADRRRSAGFFSRNFTALLSGFGEADGNCLFSALYDSTLTTLS